MEEWKIRVDAAEEDKRVLQRRVNTLLVGKSEEEREGWMVREAAEEKTRANVELAQRLANGSRQRQELEAIIECQSWLVETLLLSQEEERTNAEQAVAASNKHSSGAGGWKKEPEEYKERDEQHQQLQHQGGEDKVEDDESAAARIRRRQEQKDKRDSFVAANHLTIAHYTQQHDRQSIPQYDELFVDTPQPDERSPASSSSSSAGPGSSRGDKQADKTNSRHTRVQSVGVGSRSAGAKSEWLSPSSANGSHHRSASAMGVSRPTFSSAHREHSIARRKQLLFGSTMPISGADGFAEHKSPTIEEEGDASFFS